MDPATMLRGPKEKRVQSPRVDKRLGRYRRYGISVEEFLARKRYEASLSEKSWKEPARSYQQIAHDAFARPGAQHGGTDW
jgi:hypothetical protein